MRSWTSFSGLLVASLFVSASVFASQKEESFQKELFPTNTIYFGVNVGGGSTTWAYLVDHYDNFSTGVTPIAAKEFGPSWGLVFGYDVVRNFAMELQYVRFANSKLTFDAAGQLNYNLSSSTIISHTQAYSLSAKFYLPIGVESHLRAFSAVGAGLVVRHDVISDRSCVTPYMSAGAAYNFTRHVIIESGFQYYTGFGASEYLPVKDFVPFAWDAYVRFAYQL